MLEKTLFFYNHPESMVRTTVRNIYLSILKCNSRPKSAGNEVYYKYMVSYPYCNYFIHYACFIRDFWLNIDKNYILKDEFMLKAALEDNVDELMYLHDLINSNKPKLKKMLINAFLTYCIVPCIVGSFTLVNKGSLFLSTHTLSSL
jgi:hypothetical protein